MDTNVTLGEVQEMALCEQGRVILRPNITYVFRVIEGCPKCAALAEVYKDGEL